MLESMIWISIALSSALFSAGAAISQKKVLFEMEALDFSFVVSLLTSFFGVFFLLTGNIVSLPLTGLLVLYGKSILGALAFWCIMLAIKNMDISGALPLMVLTPAFVAVGAFVFLSESLSTTEILGMGLLLIGTYLLESKKAAGIHEPFLVFRKSKYHHYIIFALLLFTATSIIDKAILNEYKIAPNLFVGFQQIFFTINFLIFILIRKKNPVQILTSIDIRLFLWIILIAALTISYRYTQLEALKMAPVALVLSIKRTSVFFASMVGGKLFSEEELLKKGIATVIMMLGAILIIHF